METVVVTKAAAMAMAETVTVVKGRDGDGGKKQRW
jgi:hypothetical protein